MTIVFCEPPQIEGYQPDGSFRMGIPISIYENITNTTSSQLLQFMNDPGTIPESVYKIIYQKILQACTDKGFQAPAVTDVYGYLPVNLDFFLTSGLSKSRVLLTTGVDINQGNSDVAVITGLPGKYIIRRITIFEASTSLALSLATLGINSPGNISIIIDTLSELTSTTKVKNILPPVDYFTSPSVSLRNMTAHGSPATVSVALEVTDLT